MSYYETVNSQIISAIVKWGAITHQDLYYYLNPSSKFSTFRVRTHLLIKNKILKSIKIPGLKKTIIYSCEGTKLLAGNDITPTPQNLLTHNSGLSNICIRLLQLKNVLDINTIIQEDATIKTSIFPDAEALVIMGNKSSNIAIEYEATQKSKNRIIQKYISYSQSNEYQQVMYFFDSEREAISYVNTLISMKENKSLQHTSLKIEKFFFFVRNNNNEMSDFVKSFKPIYPDNMEILTNVLNEK